MSKQPSKDFRKITPDELLSRIGPSPADNAEGLSTSLPGLSKWVGAGVRNLFIYQKMLDAVGKNPAAFGWWSPAAAWQSALVDTFLRPVRASARIAVGAGRNPDALADMNGWIYKNYSRLLYTLSGFFMSNGRFDREKAARIASTEDGKTFLKNYLDEFAQLEYAYSNRGMTRLAAMKALLKVLLVVITETPLSAGKMPFGESETSAEKASFENYLAVNRRRLENLFQENAFDIKEYSERQTAGKIGCSSFEYVEGSELHRVRLRDYRPPRGVRFNGKIIYMATPLINKPELFDLAFGKSVVEAMLKKGYRIYMADHGDPGWEETNLDLDFYAKTIPDRFLEIIAARHPQATIYMMAYCMGGTLMLPYLARRAEERLATDKKMDISKVVLMASPVKFDDHESGHGPIRSLIRRDYDPALMKELFGAVNIPSQIIEAGMNEIQPGVQHNVMMGFYGRAESLDAIRDSAPFLYWLTHGTRFPINAHIRWITDVFIGNKIFEEDFPLPSSIPELDGRPVDMDVLKRAGVAILDYKGTRDLIAPAGSCVAGLTWGLVPEPGAKRKRKIENRNIEKNIGHIFVVSRRLLADFIDEVDDFYRV
ncbi:MAG TPA: hypothetical protein PK090_02805 [Smithellaceae bacterium]|nr:hypothetical protein [Smithellaceae bacterium]